MIECAPPMSGTVSRTIDGHIGGVARLGEVRTAEPAWKRLKISATVSKLSKRLGYTEPCGSCRRLSYDTRNNCGLQTRIAFSSIAWNTVSKSPGEL